uniref:Uncharacterized protein n=1 Tax=Biomphalaria glabrata TaxID=6526 RepID=A0A2C9M566_BIOGL
MYVWNKSDHSWLDYQQRYCNMRCKGEELIVYTIHRPTSWNYECIQCHCKRPACEHYRICCPDISVPFDRKSVYAEEILTNKILAPLDQAAYRKRSATPTLGCEYHPSLEHRYLFIRSCQADYDDNQTVIDLCEMDRQPHEQTIETFIKVVDPERQIVYRNKFCALCNHVTNFKSVPTTMRTDTFKTYYNAMSRDKMLQQVLRNVVEVDGTFPQNFTLLGCSFLSVPIDHCRKKSETVIKDGDIIRACETAQLGNEHMVYSMTEDKFYKSIFCAICNEASTSL